MVWFEVKQLYHEPSIRQLAVVDHGLLCLTVAIRMGERQRCCILRFLHPGLLAASCRAIWEPSDKMQGGHQSAF